MARTSYANVLALPDQQQQWNFDLFFPSIPGGAVGSNLTYRCKTSAIPSSKIEPVKLELHGVSKQEAGRATYDHTFSVTFVETVDWAVYLALRGWREKTRSWKNNTGSNSSVYKINLEADFYDNAGDVNMTLILAGAWLTDIADIAVDGSANAAVEVQCTFSFDYISDGIGY